MFFSESKTPKEGHKIEGKLAWTNKAFEEMFNKCANQNTKT